MAVATYYTVIDDLPDAVLSTIIAAVSDVRSRNSAALVCHKWCRLERVTRSSLTLRGFLRDIFMVPTCFHSISHLDLSLISPWGYPLTSASDPAFIAAILLRAFPSITSLTFYARNPYTITLVAPLWQNIKQVKLVRWHQRPNIAASGDELKILLSFCEQLTSLDLSLFYCWTDDVLPTLESYPSVASNLTCLNLLNPSFSDGFKAHEILGITRACPNLRDFRAACLFDPRYIGFIDDEALVAIPANCPKLAILHLAETSALSNARGNLEDDLQQTPENFRINATTLIELFSGLPFLEELVFDICNIVKDSGPALEVLKSKCPKLKSLKLGQFHGISLPVESKLDGLALCHGLESLSIRNAGDLTDMGLIAIGRGCCRLSKIEIYGCENITLKGMRTLACLLHKTLKEVNISSCKGLGASATLKALEPIQDRIEKLHFDCIWDSIEEDDIENTDDIQDFDQDQSDMWYRFLQHTGQHNRTTVSCSARKKRKYSDDLVESGDSGACVRIWDSLQSLSIWIPVGQLLTPLASAGIEKAPNLEEIKIKVEGDCRELSKPIEREFGLSSLFKYPKLSRMNFDCGDTIGYAHTAPSGQMDLSLWERFHLIGIGHLNLRELDYWPPQDRDVNQRSLSLPAAGLLQECIGLRKLFIHGTTHEHFMMFLLRIPNLRDVQLREDYYPAPENDMSTEMRADSCSRFEAALNSRHIPD